MEDNARVWREGDRGVREARASGLPDGARSGGRGGSSGEMEAVEGRIRGAARRFGGRENGPEGAQVTKFGKKGVKTAIQFMVFGTNRDAQSVRGGFKD